MQNPVPKLRQSSIISDKLGYLSENLKTLTSSNYNMHNLQLQFAHVSCLTISTKGCLALIVEILCY